MQNSIFKINSAFVRQQIAEIDPARSEFMSAYDDIASAQLFQKVFGKFIRYNAIAKSWYCYDGIRWKADPGDLTVERYAKLLSRALWMYSADQPSRDFQKYVFDLQQRRRRRTMIDDARDLLPVLQTDFDADPWLFNCQNCVLDLRNHRVKDHDPDLLLSKVANVAFNPDASSEVFTAFMDQIMQGDKEKIEYLQTLFGYAMTGTNEREEAYLLYGSTTRNGKGSLTNTINYLMGDYGANIQPETLAMQRNREGSRASPDIARLQGVRFLQASEPPKRMKLDVALLKTLIGRDTITARFLYQQEFEFTPCFKLFINTNHLPVILDPTLFASGRVRVITFDRHFDESEQDKGLKDRLQQPEVLSGILNWMIKGLKRYHADGNTIRIPDSVRSATEDYRLKSDKLRNFFEDVLTPSDTATVTAKEVYLSYGKWCQANGYGTENKANFLSELRERGFLSETGTINGRTYHNVVKGYMIDDYLIGTSVET